MPAQEGTAQWHFKPKDHALGDVHPFFHEGRCHLYYLKPGKYEAALAISTSSDWLQWSEVPLTHGEVKPEDWMRPYFVLGVFRGPEPGVFRSFYGHAEGRMVSSTSNDLRHWDCAPRDFSVPPAGYYQRRRDPFVFWIPEMKQWGCVMTTWIKDRPKETAGAVSLATSPDLKVWKDHGPILDPGNIGEPEVPQMFRLGGRWILLTSIYDRAVGPPVYWCSESPLGPWKSKPEGQLDGKDLCAAQIDFDGEMPVLFGWIPLKPSKPGKQHWGGHLALPREVHVLPDGRLGTRLPANVAETFKKLPWVEKPDFTMGKQAHTIEENWQRLAVEFAVTLPEGGDEIRMNIAPLGKVLLKRDQIRILDPAGECWSELPVELPAAKPVQVKLFVEQGMVECFVHGAYSLAARVPAQPGTLGLSFEADNSRAQVTKLRVSEWELSRDP
ncbi:hypothetical protein [Roseimicrobium sp. ORNL1]|uniref:hypothetical protein n=1 Tax=Roseimicrobium sp. ORNL1 TaxID=2711231 RepID=UPI0013E19D9C|nr:hypothetical protein [Roseimicrobium sp. ORNL1]QIF00635.1 hypothetical protein G5S37_03555 [Roseimicrobium sp. ORNL1]